MYKNTVYESISQGASGLQPFDSKDVSTVPGCIHRVLRFTLRWASLQYSSQMKPIHLRPILCLAMSFLAGCQAIPPVSPVSYEVVYPFYASRAEARAVAAGQFGAVPVAMPIESEIELVGPVPCKSDIAEVRSRAGRTGWIPVDDLPRRLQGPSASATETANQSLEPTRVGKPPLPAQLQR